jgi:hypothetical protein
MLAPCTDPNMQYCGTEARLAVMANLILPVRLRLRLRQPTADCTREGSWDLNDENSEHHPTWKARQKGIWILVRCWRPLEHRGGHGIPLAVTK